MSISSTFVGLFFPCISVSFVYIAWLGMQNNKFSPISTYYIMVLLLVFLLLIFSYVFVLTSLFMRLGTFI